MVWSDFAMETDPGDGLLKTRYGRYNWKFRHRRRHHHHHRAVYSVVP
jgi:hypothetical protein